MWVHCYYGFQVTYLIIYVRSSLYTPLSFHMFFFPLCPFSFTFVHSFLLSTYLRPVLFLLFIFHMSPLSFLQAFCSSIPAHLPAFLFLFSCICCSRVRLFISSSDHLPLCSFSPFLFCLLLLCASIPSLFLRLGITVHSFPGTYLPATFLPVGLSSSSLASG